MLETTLERDYRQNVRADLVELGSVSELVISNENSEEVRRFQYSVPKNIDPMTLQESTGILDDLRFEIPFPQIAGLVGTNLGRLHSLGLPIVVEIRSIPGKRGSQPGTVRIPIRKT